MYRKALTSDSLSTTSFSSIRNFPSPPLLPFRPYDGPAQPGTDLLIAYRCLNDRWYSRWWDALQLDVLVRRGLRKLLDLLQVCIVSRVESRCRKFGTGQGAPQREDTSAVRCRAKIEPIYGEGPLPLKSVPSRNTVGGHSQRTSSAQLAADYVR